MSHYSILHFIFEHDFNTGFLHETWICPLMPRQWPINCDMSEECVFSARDFQKNHVVTTIRKMHIQTFGELK